MKYSLELFCDQVYREWYKAEELCRMRKRKGNQI
jgi:hypothetical protein